MPGDQDEVVQRAELERLVVVEQTTAILRNFSTTFPFFSFISISVSYILWDNSSSHFLSLWLPVVISSLILRMMYFLKYKKYIEGNIKFDAEHFLRANFGFVLVTGLLWTSLVFVFLGAQEKTLVPLIVILSGLAAATSLQGAPSLSATLAFNLPLLSMIAIKLWLSMQNDSRYPVVIDIIIYCLFLLHSGREAQALFIRSSRLKHQAAALATSLKIEHSASMLANMQLFQLANYDSLTGLSNRAAFSRDLDNWLGAARQEAQSISLFLIDLDHFKSINDTLGHRAGDQVLKEVATRLRSATRPDHVLARLGGDEFAILLREDATPSDAVASHLIDTVNGVFMAGEHPVTIGISIGIASYPGDCATGDDLFVRADLALYAAKAAGRHGSKRFDQSMLAEAELSRAIERDLPFALRNGAIEVRYQPQVALADGAFVGVEALIRWNHPIFSWIEPPRIVAAALRTNMSRALTGYVISDANAMIGRLAALGFDDVVVSVNISPNELDRYALPELLRDMIAHQGLQPRLLELEITEDAFVSSASAIATLNAISAMGIRLSVDDFGTGCSSIAYFRSLRVARIKIDRSFVTGFTASESDRVLVQTMLGIGRSLDIEMVAEGVETADEAAMLREFGCPIAQGYFFARPLSPAALGAWIDARALSGNVHRLRPPEPDQPPIQPTDRRSAAPASAANPHEAPGLDRLGLRLA